MSFSQIWKLALASLCAFALAACAGSNKGGSGNEGGNSEYSEEEGGSAESQKVDEDELKTTQDQAVKTTEENHDLRRQIFETKTQLGISTATQQDNADDAGDDAAADAQ